MRFVKDVFAVPVGGGRGNAVAGTVEQVDRHSAEERLAGIERIVAVVSTKTWPLMLAGNSSPKSYCWRGCPPVRLLSIKSPGLWAVPPSGDVPAASSPSSIRLA